MPENGFKPKAWVAGRLPCVAVVDPENVVLVMGKNKPPAWVGRGLLCNGVVLGPENWFAKPKANWATATSIATPPVNETATTYFAIRTMRICRNSHGDDDEKLMPG